MHLREIEMENFKSFRKKTMIPFLEGYTTVTGPNGSGKSNIADAVLFVLGPRSSRAIRAGRLTDLIFNGGKTGRRAKHCKVSLVLDNQDRTIPIDTDLVKLTRFVKVSTTTPDGYNSYFYVNGRKSSLTEFDSLLAHARISADGYNIVQQGDVSRIVAMGNVERRRILDSIAGITKFDDDIARAEKKKTDVEGNLERIGIILDEIRKQIRQLDRDRGGALKYKELTSRLNLAKAQMVHKNVEMIQAEINTTREQISRFEAEKANLTRKREELQGSLEQAGKELAEMEDQIAERAGEEARELKKKMDEMRIERARAEDTIETSADENSKLKTEMKSIREEKKKVDEEISKLEDQKQEMENRLAELERTLEEGGKELASLEESASKSDDKIVHIRKEVITLGKRVDQTKDNIHNLTLEDDRLTERIERIGMELAQIEEDLKTYRFEIKDARWQMGEIRSNTKESRKNVGPLKDGLDSLRERERKLAQQAGELEEAIRSLTREYNNLKAEADAAASVEKGYNRAVMSILEARDKGTMKGVHGSVAELCEVEEKFETAIKIAAGAKLQAIIVDTDRTGESCINYLKKKGLGRAIFLPLNKMMPGRPRGKAVLAHKDSLGYAIDLMTYDDKFRNAFWYVLTDTIIVEDLKQARKLMGGVRMATLGGELIEASGAMIGGTLQKTNLKFGAPSQKEIDKVGEKLRKAIAESDKLTKELQEVKAKILETESNLKEAEESTESTQIKVGTLAAKEKEFKSKAKLLEQELEKRNKELQDAEGKKAANEEEIEKLKGQLEEMKSKRDAEKKKIIASSPEELSRKITKLQSERTKTLDEANSVKSKTETLQTQIDVITDRINEMDSRMQLIKEEMKENGRKAKSSQGKLEKLEHEIKAMEKIEDSMGKETLELREKRDEAYKTKTRIENEIDKNIHQLHTKEDFVLGLQADLRVGEEKLAEANLELEDLDAEVGEDIPPTQELKRTINECQVALETMGPVNLRALEDFDQQQERHKELAEEFKQLKSQKRDLIRLVEKLNERKKDGLVKVFHGINENFKTVYSELSGGGEAELILENEEQPFEGGLIIKAKPHNKRVLRLEALSGGEKSLVSMAFIFSIQQYDPSPFYLLDEVDQNLDAINAEKVANMIKRNSLTAQFVQVSLRKVTLKEADHIVGVTMQKNAVSDVVMKVNISEIPEEEQVPEEQEVAA
ncbi:MAG: chromosome segregation protein SMC [Methanobacteriota archaeon]|nr:MAG: chromosome segregation protein SMC [Euryarchaeota archaeon]